MIEDLGNIDQMTFLVDYLFRAGATIVPLRPVGHQTNEVVLDNDDAGVTFAGDWTRREGIDVFRQGGQRAVSSKRATSKKETAYARYTPKIPEAGFYPVYAWTSSGGDRAADQLYRVNHSGGDDGGDGQSSPRRQWARVSGHVLLRRGHERLRRYQQSLERAREASSSPT